MPSAQDSSTSPTLMRMLSSASISEAAWRMFLDRYNPLIARWCQRAGLQPADADEVHSRVLASLVGAMPQFSYDPAFSFRGWLKTVVNNAIRTFWREWALKPGNRGYGGNSQIEQVSIPSPLLRLAEELDEQLSDDLRLAEQVIARVRQRVEPHTWEAYWRTAIDEEPAADVARDPGISTGLVYVAKGRVAKLLREEGLALRDQL